MLVIASPSRINIEWEVPYSSEDYPVENYNIQLTNATSGDLFETLPTYNGTNYMYEFEDDVRYCQTLTVNVTAVSALGQSVPGSSSIDFPIGKLI